jgi:hypothetical protein
MSVNFYTFSYQNPVRAAAMRKRFEAEELELEFVEPVYSDDPRIIGAPDGQGRTWSIMWNHLDMLKCFLESGADYGVFCEDDIQIRKGLKTIMPEVIAAYKRLDLEILLLGYLSISKPAGLISRPEFPTLQNFLYLKYPDELWGSQMYLLDRKTADKFLEKYTVEFARTRTEEIPFSPDWTLTKDGRRAIIYPMLGVEEGKVATGHQGQIDFHRQCAAMHLDNNYY